MNCFVFIYIYIFDQRFVNRSENNIFLLLLLSLVIGARRILQIYNWISTNDKWLIIIITIIIIIMVLCLCLSVFIFTIADSLSSASMIRCFVFFVLVVNKPAYVNLIRSKQDWFAYVNASNFVWYNIIILFAHSY